MRRRHDPFWPGRVALLGAILLGFALPNELALGPFWLVPACEIVGFLALLIPDAHPGPREDPRVRALRLALIGLVSAVNVVSLFGLTQLLLSGGHQSGSRLIVGGAALWITAVLLFAVWFWELDRGGPVRRVSDPNEPPDFQFPQMETDGWDDWRPEFSDYLYLSLVNAASFAPAETVPLTRVAKLLMSVQTLASLATLTIVVAYAVNNLR
jgi:uncharacterized membrane protein